MPRTSIRSRLKSAAERLDIVDWSKVLDWSRVKIYDLSQLTSRKGDILVIRTGYHRYAWCGAEPDEVRYLIKHPGPDARFAKWCLEMKFRWLAIDAAAQDHPLNTVIRNARPDLVLEAEEKWKGK